MNIPKALQGLLTENVFRVASQFGVLQPVVFAFLLLFQTIGIVVIAPDWTKWVSIWTALNVFSLVGIIRLGLLFGKKGTARKCVQCDSKNVVPATFVCLDCESVIGPPKQLKDKIGKS